MSSRASRPGALAAGIGGAVGAWAFAPCPFSEGLAAGLVMGEATRDSEITDFWGNVCWTRHPLCGVGAIRAMVREAG
ncbi:hypothetical protein GCM10028793_60150 [Nocardiopsis oceani]